MADDDDFDDSFWHTGPRGAVLRRQHHDHVVSGGSMAVGSPSPQ